MSLYNIYRQEGTQMHLIEYNVDMSEQDASFRALHEEVICERVEE